MRLLFVSFIPDVLTSGMGKWTHRIADELHSSGNAVEFLFQEHFPKLRRMGRLGRQIFPVTLALRLVQLRKSFDVVVVHEPSGFFYGTLRRYAKSLPPMVVISHGVESRAFDEMVVATVRKLASVSGVSRMRFTVIRRWQSNGALRLSDHVVCLSESDLAYLRIKLGLAGDRVSLATNGADNLENVAAHGSYRALAIGTWLPEKGSLALPQVWRQIVEKVPQARLTLLGTGLNEAMVLKGFPAELSDTLTIIPAYSTPKELMEHARGASVFLLTSMREGSPLALLEAMSLGLAPVASAVGGVPEILCGQLRTVTYERFDLSAAAGLATRLLLEPAYATQVASLARCRALNLSWTATAQVVGRACRSALARAVNRRAS